MNKYLTLILLLTLFIHNLIFSEENKTIQTLYANKLPILWAEIVPGVKTRLVTDKKFIALTMDLCGGKTDGCDYRYINFFQKEKIPATIFVTNKWIKKHPKDFEKLRNDSLFDIENHGLLHRPCSVNGKSIYGIQGTKNIDEIIEEVELNAQKIKKLTGRKPRLFRSGTAYYDEIAVQIINALGYQVMGFNINGDLGATATKEETKNALLKAQSGSVVILHMNRPEKPCAEGAIEAIKELKNQGFEFVKIADFELS